MKYWEVSWAGGSADVDVEMVGKLLDALGSSEFSHALFEVLDQVLKLRILNCGQVGLDGNFKVRWLETDTPEIHAVLCEHFDKYAKSYYRNDPIWNLLPRLWSLAEDAIPVILTHHLHEEEIRSAEWRRHNYEALNISERVVMAAMHPKIGVITLSFFRHRRHGGFSEQDLTWLSDMAPLLFRLLFRHEGLRYDKNQNTDITVVEGRLHRARGVLTMREVQICSRILMGNSFEEIGTELGIKQTTVKTYRDRAFEKLGITSRYELFGILLG